MRMSTAISAVASFVSRCTKEINQSGHELRQRLHRRDREHAPLQQVPRPYFKALRSIRRANKRCSPQVGREIVRRPGNPMPVTSPVPPTPFLPIHLNPGELDPASTAIAKT